MEIRRVNLGHAKAFVLQEMKCFTSLSISPFFFPILCLLLGGFYNKISFIYKMQKENVLAVPFFLQFCTERSPHTQLQSDQNGIWGSFTSHPQQKTALFWLGFSQAIISTPALSQYPQEPRH